MSKIKSLIALLLIVILLGWLLTACDDSPTAKPAITTTPDAATKISFPALPNVIDLALDDSDYQKLKGNAALDNKVVKIYVSDDPANKLAPLFHNIFLNSGYKFTLAGQSAPFYQSDSPLTQPGNVVAFYQKAGQPDVFWTISPAETYAAIFGGTRPSDAEGAEKTKRLIDQLSNKKSVVILVAGPDVLAALKPGLNYATPTPPQGGPGTP